MVSHLSHSCLLRPQNGTCREGHISVPFVPFDPDSYASNRGVGLTPEKALTYTEVWGTELQDTGLLARGVFISYRLVLAKI